MKEEKSYGISALIAIIGSIIIHYLFISKIDLHPTLHVTIGILMFFVIMGALSLILSNK
jgi:hypothetical protein